MFKRARALVNGLGLIFLLIGVTSLIFVARPIFNAHFGSAKDATSSGHSPLLDNSQLLVRRTLDKARAYVHEEVTRFQNRWTFDFEDQPKRHQHGAKLYPSEDRAGVDHQAHRSAAQDHEQFSHSHLPRTTRESLNIASEAARDVWRVLKPSAHAASAFNAQSEDEERDVEHDPASEDEVLARIRGIIHILAQTHNSLLEEKLTKLHAIHRVWFKYLYFYRDPYIIKCDYDQSPTGWSTLLDLARSAKEFATNSGSSNVLKEKFNAMMDKYAKGMLQAISALKQSARGEMQDSWLATPEVHAFLRKVTQSMAALREKWLQLMGGITVAIRPIADKMPSHEQIQYFIDEVDYMVSWLVSEFKEEVRRMRIEWIYRRIEARAWAKQAYRDLKQRTVHDRHRTSENLNAVIVFVKKILNESWEQIKENFTVVRRHVTEHAKRLLSLRLFWNDVMKSVLGNCYRLFLPYVSKLWRAFAFIAIVVFFRFLLGFVHLESYVRSALSSAASGQNAGAPTNKEPETNDDRQTDTLHSGSPRKSQTSESGTKKNIFSPDRTASSPYKPSRVPEGTPPQHNIPVKPLVQRRERRTVSKPSSDRTLRQTRPLQVSNMQYENPLSSLEKQMDGRPIHLGDHEVQLVYEDVPRDTSTSGQRNHVNRKRTPTAARPVGSQRTPLPEDKQSRPNSRKQTNDDVVTINSSDESTSSSSRSSASLRKKKSSLRRTFAQRNQAR